MRQEKRTGPVWGRTTAWAALLAVLLVISVAPGAMAEEGIDAGLPVLPDPVAAARRDAGLRSVKHGFGKMVPVPKTYPAMIDNPRLLNWINSYSRQNKLDPRLVYALVEQESAFDPRAVSPKGAQGLMQIMPDTQKLLGLTEPFDPERNIAAGTRYLRAMLDKFQTEVMALAAYNAGPGAVAKHGGVPPYEETKDYVLRVVNRYFALRLRYPETGVGTAKGKLVADETKPMAKRKK